MNKTIIALLVITIYLFIIVSPSESKVYMKRDEALNTAFPDAGEIERKEIFLSSDQSQTIESLAYSKNESKLYIIYEAKNGEKTLGYAIIDTHSLRTKTETVMFVINPDGSLRQAEILAFFEPQDYQAGENWIELFEGKTLDDTLRVGKDIPNITGATITANSLSQAIRRILAVFKVASDQGQLN
ncbi:MAG: FMN-binding protein [Candidatus Dadabacteria bacterium]|nr:FMN-binding protein [Candidatus Dadabacteria bacterium]MCZ6790445.1 FMN-binding protein [Candidatus Dadabacteria bacterium]